MYGSIVPFWLFVTLALSQGQRSQLQPRVVGDRRRAGRLDTNAFQAFNFATPGVNQRGGPAPAWSRPAQVPVMPIGDSFHDAVATGDSDWDSVVGQPIPRLDTRAVSNTVPDVGFVPNNFRGRGCDKRIRVLNGATRIRDRGTLARFQCSYGFHMLGASVAVCVQGKWSDPPPLCVRDGCRKLTIPIHGTLRMLYGGAVGIFTCNYGYKVEGERVLMCDGQQWNGTAPYCSEIPPVAFEPPTTTTLAPTRPPAIEQPTTLEPEMSPIDIETPTTPETFTTTENDLTIEISEVEVQNNLEQETTTDSVFLSVEATSTPAPTRSATEAKNDVTEVATESTISQITTPTISSTSTLKTVETTLSVLIPEQPVLDNETDQSTTTTQMTNEVQQVEIPAQTIPPNTKMATTTSAPEVLDAPTTETTLSSVSDEVENQLPQIATPDDSTVTAETHDQMSTAPPEVSKDQLTSTETSNTGQAASPVSSTNDVTSTDYSSILLPEPESDIVTVPSQPISEEESVIFHEEPPVTAVTVDNGPTVTVTSKVNVLAETSPLPDTAQTQFQQEFDFSHENSRIREYVAISPSKLDVDSGHSGHHWAVGQLLVIAGTALVTIGCVTIAAALLMYCWRRNKGIARPRRNDTDGRTLSFHEGTDELIWYDPRTGEGELTRL